LVHIYVYGYGGTIAVLYFWLHVFTIGENIAESFKAYFCDALFCDSLYTNAKIETFSVISFAYITYIFLEKNHL